MTDEILKYEKPMLNSKIVEYEHKEIRAADNNYNVTGDIRLEITSENAFTRPSDSYLLIEGQLRKADGTNYADADLVSLTKEGPLFLFSNIRYYINEKEIESIYDPGQTQCLLSYLLEDQSYNDTVSLVHCGPKDTSGAAADGNIGFTTRRTFLLSSNPVGSFSFYIPLRRLFGFFREFDNLVFGTTQRVTLVRKEGANDAIFRAGAAAAGNVHLTKVAWFVPHVQGNDETNLALLKHINSKKDIDIGFRAISSNRIAVPQDSSFTWRLASRSSPEVPRYLILAFQTNREGNQEANPALFDHCNLTHLHVQLNEKQYPNSEYTCNFAMNQFSRVYLDATEFKSKLFDVMSTEKEIVTPAGLSPVEFKGLVPVFVVDLSKQVDRVKHSVAEVTIHARFSNPVPAQTRAFYVLVSDKFMKLESDGHRLVLIQN